MMSDPLFAETSPEISRAIRCDQICDQFEVTWRAAVELEDRPSLEDHLALGGAQDQPFLLQELIRLDVHYRRSAADAPQAADYLPRFALLAPKSLDEILCEVTRQTTPLRAGSNLVGRTFGDYALLSEIARGGMGVVYRARQISLNRIVALKMILSGPHASTADILRFRAEAEAAANLNHSGIVPIHEVGEHEGQHYFSMGYVAGQSLAARLIAAPLPPREAAEIVRDVARAVQYAHEQQVIHRDLKPANILLDEANRPLVTDFGLARQLSRDSSLTNTGDMIGTPCFMSPEQASGGVDQVGPAADVYALGAVLYATLTGRPPFQAATPVATLQQVLNDEPVALGRLNRAVPKDLETISLKCLAKSPARRYASAAALADDLGRWLQGEAILARPTPVAERVVKWARRRPAVAALSSSLVAITLIAFVLITSFGLEASRVAARFTLINATGLCEEGDINRGLLMFSYTLSLIPPQDRDLRDAVLANLSAWSQETIPLSGLLEHPGVILSQQFSSDDKYLLTVCSDRCLRIWNVSTGTQVRDPLLHTGDIHVAIFSPDSKYILTGCQDGLVQLCEVRTQSLTERPWRLGSPINAAAFYGDSQQVIVGTDKGTFRWNVNTDHEVGQPVVEGNVNAIAVSSVSGESLMLAIGLADGSVQLRDAATFKLAADQPEDVAGQIQKLKFGGDGRWLLATALDEQRAGIIYVWEVATGKLVPGLTSRWEIAGADIDQTRDFVFIAGADFTAELWELGSKPLQKTLSLKHADVVGVVAFSLDDSPLLLTGSNGSIARLWDRTTGSPLGPPLKHPSPIKALAFSPKGSMFSTVCEDHLVRLWKTPSVRRQAIPHTSAVMAVAVSPSGDLIATGTSGGDVYVRRRDGIVVWHNAAVHDDEVWAIAFTADGNTLVTGGRDRRVVRWDARTGNRFKPHHHGYKYKIRSLCISPDDRPFLTASGTSGKGLVQLWDLDNGSPIDPPLAQDTTVWAVAMAPAASSAACAASSGEDKIRLWRKTLSGVVPQKPAEFGEAILLPFMHQARVVALAFSPDGKWMASGSTDQTARLWNVDTGQVVGAELKHGSGVWSAAFSNDSRFLLTACGDGAVHMWDVATGSPVGPIRRHQGAAWNLAVDPGGSSVWTVGEDRQLREWPLSAPLRESDGAIQSWIEKLTGMEFDDHQSAHWLSAAQWQKRRGLSLPPQDHEGPPLAH